MFSLDDNNILCDDVMLSMRKQLKKYNSDEKYSYKIIQNRDYDNIFQNLISVHNHLLLDIR